MMECGRGNGADISETELAEQFFGEDTASDSDAATDGDFADGKEMQRPDGDMDSKQGGPGGGMGSDDVSLIYSDDEYSSYSNIFDNAKTDITDEDKERLIASLKSLNENSDIENVINVDEVIRYFVVHNFV